jgi:DMSO/TMAO reductase YedYZ molybdopterin-dependent catalytic subunit
MTLPFDEGPARTHTGGDFSREEVRLANRNSGILLETLRHDVTPAGMHYLLNHFDVPFVPDASNWGVTISGHVAKPFRISLDEIKSLPQRTLRVTLECAGNGRANLEPRWPSMPWGECAVGTSEWTGTPMKPIIERAGLTDACKEVVFSGIDRGFDKVEHDYERSLAKAMALSDDVLLVTAMNGQPLLPQHGYPLRMVVPGWYGMASVKWLDRITAIDHAFLGHQQVGTYIYKSPEPDDPGIPVTTIRVKSLMVPPGMPDWYTRRRVADVGNVTVHGRAWSGAGVPIEKVEFACDGTWQPAVLEPQSHKYAWRGWHCVWQATKGDHVLRCRATDANGDVQPLEQRWDRGGFGNNVAHSVDVTVR